jgi:hypothetical protein
VIAFARRGKASALRHSRHVVCYEITAPEKNVEESLSDLQSLLGTALSQTEKNRLILFPLDDKAVWLCSRLGNDERVLLAGPSGSRAELVLKKHLQVSAAKIAGFNVPATALVRNKSELVAFSESQPFPLILKADDCVPISERRVYACRKWICANRNELNRAIEKWEGRVPLLAQSFVTGIGEGAFGLASPEGVRAWSGHHRVRMMNPQGSGSSACESQPVSEEVKHSAQQMVTNAGWQGLFMIELLRDEQGKLWFVEMNGRPWGSMALCRRQGFEYPAWHVDLALNAASPAGLEPPKGFTMICRHIGREFMHVLFVLKGAKSNALERWPSFWKTLWDVFRIRRTDGIYNWRKDDKKVFWADFYHTIHSNVFKENRPQ